LHLVDVHGQSEHFFLLSEDNQLNVVDGICGEDVGVIKSELADLIKNKRGLKAKIAELGGDGAERERKLDLLEYQIKEIENADLKEGEFDELKTRRNIIANTEKILSSISGGVSALNDDGGALDCLSTAQRAITGISSLSDNYAKMEERLEEVYAEISDICETLTDYADELTFDGREAEEIDERITLIKNLRKKYGADEKEILNFLEDSRAQFDLLSDGANAVEKYNKQISECDEKIYALCKKLTNKRKFASDKFCNDVTAQLKTLNIPDAQFSVKFAEYDEQTANLQSLNGSDNISFMFSANKGEPLKPLNKVISGGEMSRFMLAVKTVLKDVNGISTYIFDEIDAGISGYTANAVAEKFVRIAENTQILAVSHLPQVCAASGAQFLIYKENNGDKTVTKVKRLDEESKINEIIRLTGSVNSEAAKIHAKELIAQYKN